VNLNEWKYVKVEKLRNFKMYTDNGGSKQLWNVGVLLPHCTAQQPKKQPSSLLRLLKEDK
jgi:hypothetical protein